MKAKANFKVGGVVYQLEVEDKDDLETLNRVITLANPPRTCDECGEQVNRLISNKDKEGNTYVSMKCGNCDARAKLGSYKTGGFFWHQFEKYVKPEAAAQVPIKATVEEPAKKEIEDDEDALSVLNEID